MLRYLTSGESHGPQLTAIIDGFPAGFSVDAEAINGQLARRQKGHGRGGRMRIETDTVQFLSGLRHGKTLGGPITLVIANRDWENWKEVMDPLKPSASTDKGRGKKKTTPRPGHGDLPGGVKWHHHDMRNVLERASARETAARVAAGSLVRQLLESFGVKFASHVVQIGQLKLHEDVDRADIDVLLSQAESSAVRCIDPSMSAKMVASIEQALKDGDTLGGVVELVVRGLPIGLGGCSQWSDRLDGRLAGALMSIQSVKGVEVGLGFAAAFRPGSDVHDQIYYSSDGDPARKKFHRKTNHAGGLEGGMTNGEDIVIRVACKPISTLTQPLDSVDVVTKQAARALVERTDSCIVPVLGVVCEAVAALVVADAFLQKFGCDNMTETTANYQSFLNTDY